MTEQLLYAIGDIHGCYNAFLDLFKAIHNDRQGRPAKIVFLGDYVDRGPDSALVVDHLRTLWLSNPDDEVEYVFLKGNHEDMLIADNFNLNGWGGYIHNGGRQTDWSYENNNLLLTDHKDFYNALERYHRHGDFFFVHAGLPYGSRWESLQQALDASINARDGEDYLIWARESNHYEGEFPENVFVIHGHTPTESVTYLPNQINIDTGCVFGKSYSDYGKLTGIRIDGRKPEDITVFQTREFPIANDYR